MLSGCPSSHAQAVGWMLIQWEERRGRLALDQLREVH